MQHRFQLKFIIKSVLHCSYKEAELFCTSGQVRVDNFLEMNPNSFIEKHKQICIDNKVIQSGFTLTYILFHKPFGYECTANRLIDNNIFELLPPEFQDLFPLGRLDKNSEGLLLLTNDGRSYKRLMEDADVEKEYLVYTLHPVSSKLIQAFKMPYQLGLRTTLPAKLELIDPTSFKITLKEGINRQIRRICAKNENQVKRLIRIRFGLHQLLDIKIGEWKAISHF